MMIRKGTQKNKRNLLPVGISRVWRKYPAKWHRRPTLEYSVSWTDKAGKHHVKHFYVGTEPTSQREIERLAEAIRFRNAHEASARSHDVSC
jgi:hypothetical protein